MIQKIHYEEVAAPYDLKPALSRDISMVSINHQIGDDNQKKKNKMFVIALHISVKQLKMNVFGLIALYLQKCDMNRIVYHFLSYTEFFQCINNQSYVNLVKIIVVIHSTRPSKVFAKPTKLYSVCSLLSGM